jgi:hypothetical protein
MVRGARTGSLDYRATKSRASGPRNRPRPRLGGDDVESKMWIGLPVVVPEGLMIVAKQFIAWNASIENPSRRARFDHYPGADQSS